MMINFWEVDMNLYIWLVDMNIWLVDMNIWLVDMNIRLVVAEISHHSMGNMIV